MVSLHVTIGSDLGDDHRAHKLLPQSKLIRSFEDNDATFKSLKLRSGMQENPLLLKKKSFFQ